MQLYATTTFMILKVIPGPKLLFKNPEDTNITLFELCGSNRKFISVIGFLSSWQNIFFLQFTLLLFFACFYIHMWKVNQVLII